MLSGYPDFPDFSKSYPEFSKNYSRFLGHRTTTLTASKSGSNTQRRALIVYLLFFFVVRFLYILVKMSKVYRLAMGLKLYRFLMYWQRIS